MSSSPAASRFGNAILARADALARHSDVDPADVPAGAPRPLTVTYLTEAHRACAADLLQWMRDDGFDEAGIDAVGNVVGLYRGTDPLAPRLLTGSHYDTVRNAGRYDGRLGIFVPMACVRELHLQGRRLPFDVEVVGFAEEEGQRFAATFIGSGALVGQFDPAWLALRDAQGVSMGDAMRQAGHDPAAVAALRRDPSRYRGFIEVHIEQGPVLCRAGLPLGVVTAINGSVRFVGEMTGVACHAGTTPMGQRRDAATGVAELALYVERRAAQVPLLVGTVGQLHVPDGSINVVPGRCRFSLDLRAPSDDARDALVADVLAELSAIAARRGLGCTLQETMRASAAPSDAALQRRWERAVTAVGVPVFHLPSGAGHDAMKLHEAMPQAMLFMRGGNDGISHNPLEAISAEDTQLAVEAFLHFLVQLAETPQP
jgi:N-carbamoyl-L-amino-acid hydrolase